MSTMKDFFLRPTFDSVEEAQQWDKLQRTINHTKQFNVDFDQIVVHKDLYGTFFYYYLQEIRYRIIQILSEFTVVEWREPKPDKEPDPFAGFGQPQPKAVPKEAKELVIPEYGIRVKGYKEKLPLECCGQQFKTLTMLRTHYHAEHEKHYLFEANTCEMKAAILKMCVFRHELDKFVRSGIKSNGTLSFFLLKILRKIIPIIRY
ncbi:uncharacterized protein LOC129730727 [Wyeomyia smithii]|uniref:uncharacterized protein LOC129730727 n=1 Tax=Wyeomyia smithii TaxID=174621 RepID=UPI002467E05D|nr:uncharacterized protein LOC129730727 [Wyeomyia smithii]XP_055546255.1 uncharacterized protein LOC129730727 [Wyeomyia smithii]